MNKRVKFVKKKVGEIMTHDVIAVDKTLTVLNACAHMVRNRVRSLLIMSEGTFKGIVTASDIIFKVLVKGISPNKLQVGQVMSSPLITIDSESTIEEACKLMMEKKIRHLPVVRRRDIIGMLTPTDILRGVEF